MEHALKCNVLKCRKELSDQALVTTCSHIFCVDCSKRHGLTGQVQVRRKSCPACECQLNNPDDAVVTNLNLTEDYKTSVLSGLSPNIIMECAGRALSFWAYQTTQEVIYQRYLEKTLTEKLKTLNVKFEKTVGDANAGISSLQEKMQALSDDYNDMRRKHEELARSYQDKCRKLTQVQELYDKVKRKAELGQMEAAASDAVDSNLQYGSQLPAFEFPEPAARQNIYEPQSQSAYNNAHSYVGPERGHRRPLAGGGGSGPLRDDRAWSKPGPAQGGIMSTPRARTRYTVMPRFGGTRSINRYSSMSSLSRVGEERYIETGQESPKTMPKKRKRLQKFNRPRAKSGGNGDMLGGRWLQAAAQRSVQWWRQCRGRRHSLEARRQQKPRLLVSSPMHVDSSQTALVYSALRVLPELGSGPQDRRKLGLQWEALGSHPIWRTGESQDER
ncbi:hypothetical protein CSIM01_02697 [Colletotrichum simmondsii]|uniref:RING-type domain-containing protein n=1 Tax=Colletotrichum simmondsii TaxID=703756 RepID=A0A135RUN8_9PEZI|nr:hypothetical protein CSIM01_02697 [Colletotrichum simmondsii]